MDNEIISLLSSEMLVEIMKHLDVTSFLRACRYQFVVADPKKKNINYQSAYYSDEPRFFVNIILMLR